MTSGVIRDLLTLLNTWEILPPFDSPSSTEVECSVLNYGVPNVAGKMVSPNSLAEYEAEIREAVRRFEPRIDFETLEVSAEEPMATGSNAVFSLKIEGDLVGLESSRRLVFVSRVSAATGRVELA